MLKLNVKSLTEAIVGLEAYKLRIEENKGIKYLYDMLYTPMANGDSLRICDIDFGVFTLDDVEEFEDHFDNRIYYHGSVSYHISNKLRELPPVASKTSFI